MKRKRFLALILAGAMMLQNGLLASAEEMLSIEEPAIADNSIAEETSEYSAYEEDAFIEAEEDDIIIDDITEQPDDGILVEEAELDLSSENESELYQDADYLGDGFDEESGELAAPNEYASSVDSGTCGDNLTWVLDDLGTLTISGNGAMADYSGDYRGYQAPWYSVGFSIKTVVIKNGVTNIDSCAFRDCQNLTSITIPDSVTSIGDYAFQGCISLTNISIPDSVTNIGNCAFFSCWSLMNIAIPDSVTSIGPQAFTYCSSLTSITIPDSVTSIEWRVFESCSSLTSITIPDSVASIGWRAFKNCSSLTSITIPGSVASIDSEAFYGCSSLTGITISSSVISIGQGAFDECSSLTNVYYGGSKTEWKAISIDSGNDWLTNATIHYNSTGPGEDDIIQDASEVSLVFEEDSYFCDLNDSGIITATYISGSGCLADNISWSCSDENAVSFSGTSIMSPEITGAENTYWISTMVTGLKAGSFEITLSVDGLSQTVYIAVGYVNNISGWSIRDTYSFHNLTNVINTSYYEYYYGKAVAKVMQEKDNGTGGQCYGMVTSAMASVVYDNPAAETYSDNVFFIPTLSGVLSNLKSSATGITASEYIKYAYVVQYYHDIVNEKTSHYHDYSGLYHAVVNSILNNGEPVAIGIRGTDSKGDDAGHALWALGIGENNLQKTEIIVYDCNTEGHEQILTLYKTDDKYTSWEYEPYGWGTGGNFENIYYSTPADYFIQAYENPASVAHFGLFISASSKDSTITDTSGAIIMLDPNNISNTDKLLPIQTENLGVSSEANNLFWSNIGNEFTLSSSSEAADFDVATPNSGISISIPANSQANTTIYENAYNSVQLNLSGNQSFAISYYDTDEKQDSLKTVTLSGTGTEVVKTTQTKEGVTITGATDLTVTSDNGTADTTKTDVTISSGQNSILISENNGKISVSEDRDGDGIYETNIAGEKTEAHTHVWDSGVITKAATCTAAGVITYTCISTNCGATKTEVLAAKGHTWGSWTTTSAATVFAPEQQMHRCSVCKSTETRSTGNKLSPAMSLNASSLKLKKGQSTTALKVSGMANGDSVKSVASNKTKILKVVSYNASGSIKLKAQKKTGTAKLIITLASGLSKTISVKVQSGTVKTTKIKVNTKQLTLKKGNTATLAVTVTPITSQQKVTYTSSNKKVATVTSKGVIKAKKAGTAKITVKSGSKKATVKIKVTK